jgi:hypothetical protein
LVRREKLAFAKEFCRRFLTDAVKNQFSMRENDVKPISHRGTAFATMLYLEGGVNHEVTYIFGKPIFGRNSFG